MKTTKTLALIFFALLVIFTGCKIKNILIPQTDEMQLNNGFVLNEATLKFKDKYNIVLENDKSVSTRIYLAAINRIFKKYDVKGYDRPLKSKSLENYYRITLKENNFKNTSLLIEELNKLEYVEYASFVPAFNADIIPNDPSNSSQYHLSLTKTYQAFDMHQGGSKIAIIDTGFDLNHEDLNTTIWTNTGEVANNGVDDDGNGYIDDINGWDTGDNDNIPGLILQTSDKNYWHGTHVAGVAGADTDNNIGVSSMGFDNIIIPLKATKDSNGSLDAWAVVNAITYAINVGADVINISLSSESAWSPLEVECNNAYSGNIIVVASAGNLPTFTGKIGYPAFYPNVIAVTATDANDEIWQTSSGQFSMSNFGDDIDISAPGRFIHSTMPNDNYSNKSGTSMAAPIISGLAGLMKSHNPSITPDQFKHCIQQTAVDIDHLNPGYAGWLGFGRVDAEQAIQCGTCSSGNTISLSAISPSPNLQEHEVGNNINFSSTVTGTPSSYEWVFYKSGSIIFSTTTSIPSLNFTPISIGTYKVKLTAIGASPACNQTIFHQLKVGCGINASFAHNSLISPGTPLNIVNTSSNSNSISYTWYLNGVPYSFLPPTTINSPGTYLLKLVAFHNDYNCSTEYESYFTVFECPINQPIISDVTVCQNQNVSLLTANASNYTVKWFDNITDVTPLYSGNTYNLGSFSSAGTHDYFVEHISEAPSYFVGESNSPGGAVCTDQWVQMYFTSNIPFYFKSFKAHIVTGGLVTFQLSNTSGVVWTSTQNILSGIQYVDVGNTYLPADNYTLTMNIGNQVVIHSFSNSNFPYTILGGDFSITGATTFVNCSYPGFYDIEISTTSDCISAREDVIVTVVSDSNDSDGDGICDSGDQCPGLDDKLIGTPCDDGNPCTENDSYNKSCNCIGSPINTFNLLVMDDPLSDTGIEPNPGNIWNGNIWNCATNPACSLASKENPEYKVTGYNTMKVLIHNDGCEDHLLGQSRLHLYWTIARTGELWREHWINQTFEPSNNILGANAGSEITPSGGKDVKFISAGNSIEMEQDWIAPNPANFPSISATPMICFLVRVESIKDPISGEVYGNIAPNVRNSNNIATINETLVDIDPGNLMSSTYSLILNNPTSEPIFYHFSIENIDTEKPNFFELGRMNIQLLAVSKEGEEKRKIEVELKKSDQMDKINSNRIQLKPNESKYLAFTFNHPEINSINKKRSQYKLKMTGKYSKRKVKSTEFIFNVKIKSKR